MGSGASTQLSEAASAAPGDLKAALAWKDTVLDNVVVVGDYAVLGGIALGRGALEKAVPFSDRGDKKLVCIVDCGQADIWFDKIWPFAEFSCLKDKTIATWVILMPSMDSDPCYYGSSLTQSMVVAASVCSTANESPDADIRFIQRDFYFANPLGSAFEWLPAFLATDAKILPGSKKDSIKAWHDGWVEKVWGMRAGIHCACMVGMDEMEISEGIEILETRLKGGKAADDADYRAPGSIVMIAITADGAMLQVVGTKMGGDEVFSELFNEGDKILKLDDFFRKTFPESGPPTFWNEADKIPTEKKIGDHKTLTATQELSVSALPDLVQFPQACVRFACGACHGLAKEFSLEEFVFDEATSLTWKEARADICIFADVESLSVEFDQALAKIKETIPQSFVTLIVVAKEFDGFKRPNFALHLSAAMEIEVCVLATLDDIDKIKSVFLQTAPTYPNGKYLYQAMVPYPRVHFFTLVGQDGKTCGRDVPDGSLLFTSLKYGSSAPTPSKQKLGSKQYILGPEGPLHFVTEPGENKATLVTPWPLLLEVFKLALLAGCTEMDKDAQEDAIDNVRSWRSDLKSFLAEGEASEDEKVEGDEPARSVKPDGSLEGAQTCLRAAGRASFKEVKALSRPPERLLFPMKAAAALLNVEVDAADEWKSLQRMLGHGDFVERLLDVKPEAITEAQWGQIKPLAANADFTYESQSCCSLAGAAVTAFILALVSLAPKEGE